MPSDPKAPDSAAADSDTPDFEHALSELEGLVERLERGDLPLEEALRTFERGVELTRHCQSSLNAAQQKVEILLKRGGQSSAEAFVRTDEDSPAAPGPE
ncbi:MAG TPA: exodeoxyribonuclease VII small subunit [Steroidobacteraceae bacterium]